MEERDIKGHRLTIRDEFGNANVIGLDRSVLYSQLTFGEMNLLTQALNRLAAYEDAEYLPNKCEALIEWLVSGGFCPGKIAKNVPFLRERHHFAFNCSICTLDWEPPRWRKRACWHELVNQLVKGAALLISENRRLGA